MKKLTILIVLITLFNNNLYSQVKWGLLAGTNLSNITMSQNNSSNFSETKNRVGFRIGISTDIPLSDAFSLNTGIVYSVKGYLTEIDYSLIGSPTLGKIEANTSFRYFDIPLDFSYKISDLLSISTGPYLGLFVGGKTTTNGGSQTLRADDFSTTDFGLSLGAKFSLTEVFSISTGYQLGITDISEGSEVYNKSFLLAIEYTFNKY